MHSASFFTTRSNSTNVDALLAAPGGDAARRVSAFPTHVGGWPVDGRHGLVQQTQINSELRAMMRRVQDTPPEDPDPFAFNVKERHNRQPPVLILPREELQTFP